MVTRIPIEKYAPERVKMSYDDYLTWARDDQIMEWVNGEGITYMPPVSIHQNIVGFLYTLINTYNQHFQSGFVFQAPFEVKLWPDGPSREPDLLFLSQQNKDRLSEKRLNGAPDLVIEVISPGSVSEDRVRKFNEYEQAGVQEYWIIDPRPHQQQGDFYRRGEDNLFESVDLDEHGVFYSTVLPQFWLNVAWLWQDPLPSTQLIFAEIMLTNEGLPLDLKQAYQTLYDVLQAQQHPNKSDG
ncbi:MAG: Uma2 family endonuclease [Chloroflexota bacterium]